MNRGRRTHGWSYAPLLLVAATVIACDSHPAASSGIAPALSHLSADVESVDGGGAGTLPHISVASFAAGIEAAAASAESRGSRLTVAVLDRRTGARVVGGVDEPIETASVVKLFMADDLLFREATGEVELAEDEYDLVERMLRSSDDTAASLLWDRYGGSEMIARVVERHGLTGTTPPDSSWWWNTTTTASDLLTWYDDLLSGRGGFDDEATARIVGYLVDFTSTGTDGYDQEFGLPDGLPAVTELGVKQGWMCCLDGEWIHLSTGFFGDDHRYVVAVTSRETVTYDEDDPEFGTGILPDSALYDVTYDASAQHARDTVSLAVTTVFGGKSEE